MKGKNKQRGRKRVTAGIGQQADRTDGVCAADYSDCLNKNCFQVSRGTTGKQILVRIVFILELRVKASEKLCGEGKRNEFYIIQP